MGGGKSAECKRGEFLMPIKSTYTLMKNTSSSDTTSTTWVVFYSGIDTAAAESPEYGGLPTMETLGWSNGNKVFAGWNTAADGTGTSFNIGQYPPLNGEFDPELHIFAIWENVLTEYLTNDQELTAVADAIRAKGGTSAPLAFPTGFVSAVNGIATFNPFGESLELLSTYPKTKMFLKDTPYSTLTPSTTSSKVIVSASLVEDVALDMSQYEYLIKFISDADVHYVTGTTLKAAPVRQVVIRYYYIIRRWSNVANLSAGTYNYNYANPIYSPYAYDCYDSSGNHLLYTGSFEDYGFFINMQSQSFSNNTSTTPTLHVRFPAICIKCDVNRFSTTMANAVDVDASSISYWGFLYRCKIGSFARTILEDVAAIYNGQGTGV